MAAAPAPNGGLRLGRLEGLSDAVFGVAITLLVVDLAVPAGSEDRLLHAVLEQWPAYLSYVISFFTVGAVWIAHTSINEYLERADSALLRLNLVLLFFVAFLPFPTRLVGEHVRQHGAERVAVTLYGLALLAMHAALTMLWRYALASRLVRADPDQGRLRALTDKLTPSAGFYGFALVIGLLVPIAATALYAVIAVYMFLPLRLFQRVRRGRSAGRPGG